MLSKKDKERLRYLGSRIKEISELDAQQENKKLWRAVNDGKMIRPVAISRDYPVILLRDGTEEMEPTIEDPYWQRREMEMLLTIYEWNHLRNNRVVEPYVNCPAVVEDTGVGLRMSSLPAQWEMDASRLDKSYAFERVLFGEEDIEKIKMPKVTYDEKATMQRYDEMREILDGVIDVKLFGINNFRFAMFDDIFAWTTLSQGMLDMYDNPEYLHLAAKRYVQCFTHRAKQYEELGLISSNNCNIFIGNGGYGYCSNLPEPTESGIGGKLAHNWGIAQDQILSSVSPAATKEFAFENTRAWTELYPQIYYGCCERLDNKIDELGTFKNLKKVSVSPYSNLEAAMEKIGTDYIVSFKPNSNYLTSTSCEMDLLKDELIRVCELARKYNSNVEIIMKTIITLRGEPQRLWRWCEMADDIIKNY